MRRLAACNWGVGKTALDKKSNARFTNQHSVLSTGSPCSSKAIQQLLYSDTSVHNHSHMAWRNTACRVFDTCLHQTSAILHSIPRKSSLLSIFFAYLILSALSLVDGKPISWFRLCGRSRTERNVREDSTEGSPCQPKTEAQLYDQLRNLGEFNNRYMGITPDNFPDILEISKVKNDTYEPERFNPQRANKVLKHQIEQLMKTYDWSKEEATAQAQKLGLQDIKTPEELNISRRMTRDVDGGEGTTTINYCLPRGSETEDRFIRLCTVCAATTELPENYFPRYINEAICDPDGSGRACFPFEGTTEGHGMCKQRVFNLSMLKRTGNCVPTQGDGEVLYLEEWEVYTQPIRVWCDCELYRQSFLAEMTK
ncbi:uncharacterized protein [Ptychodera flava]|uniref:uncharacterized protein isoform X2 n=1 Tax=Ptychodera flava TaxID=63121 RepID=UPI00396A99A4